MADVDLIAELDALADEAQQALKRLQVGDAKNGTAALQKIRARAADAARHGRLAEASRVAD